MLFFCRLPARCIELLVLSFGSGLSHVCTLSTFPTMMAPFLGLKTFIATGPMGSSWHKLSGR